MISLNSIDDQSDIKTNEVGWRSTKALPSKGSLRFLPQILKSMQLQPIFVVGNQSFEPSTAAKFIFKEFGKEVNIYRVCSRLPSFPDPDAARVVRLAKGSPCIVAIGGGNVIDTAKLLSLGESDKFEFEARLHRGERFKRVIPLVAIPTTVGSGSEATPFAVVYIGNEKYSVDDSSILPNMVLLDPSLAISNSPANAASSGLDVIAHCIESMLSRRATPESNSCAKMALKLAITTIDEFVKRRTLTSATSLMTAAHNAGRAIAITRTTIPHALSYHLTAVHGIAHGHAVALSMGGYLETFFRAISDNAQKYQAWKSSAQEICSLFSIEGSQDMRYRWRVFVERLGLPMSLANCGISQNALPMLVGAINTERFKNSPLDMSPASTLELFDK